MAAQMGPEESFDVFKQCAVEVLQVEPSKIVPEARFADDLDADSLDLVELVMALEERFGIDVPESELEGVQTIGQAYELVASKILMLAVAGAPDGTGAVRGRRVVVTGLGVVSSCGTGPEAFWQGLLGPAPVGRARPVEGLDVAALFGRASCAGRTASSSWPPPPPTKPSPTPAASRSSGETPIGRARSSGRAWAAWTRSASSTRSFWKKGPTGSAPSSSP